MLRILRIPYWIILCILPFHGLKAQKLSFRYLGSEQGMNSLTSRNCTVDQYGFLWVSTADGLVRFNGKEAVNYSSETHPELKTNAIGFVNCDSRNRIWISMNDGLLQLDENRIFKPELIVANKPDLNVDATFEAGDQRIYAMTSAGTFSCNPDSANWKSEPWLDSLLNGRRWRDPRSFDSNRMLIVIPSAGVLLINTVSRKQEAFFPYKDVNCAVRYDDHSILIGKSKSFGLIHVSIDQPGNPRYISPPSYFHENNPHEQINYMVKAVDGNIYMTTVGSGLLVLDQSLNNYTQYKHDPVDAYTLATNSLRYIIIDTSGNIVITSLDGVNYSNVYNNSIEYINYLRKEDGTIIDERVISLAEDQQGQLWICTPNNVFIFNEGSRIVKEIQFPSSIHFNNDELSPMYVERDIHNQMWVALRYEGVAVFDPNGKFRKLIRKNDFSGIKNGLDRPRVLREGHDGYMYIGTEDGLVRLSHDGTHIDTFKLDTALSPLRQERIVDILPVRDALWVSSSPGGAAWHYSFTEKKLKSFDDQNGLPTDRIYGLASDHTGNVYVGSYGGFSIIQQDNAIVNITKGNGLISTRIESLETAEDGSIWMTNQYNLLKYDPENGQVYKLGGRYGLFHVNYVIMASTTLSSGKMAFGANKGFILVDPSIISLKNTPLRFFAFYKAGNRNEREYLPGHDVRLSYKERNIRFSFAVNEIMMADQISYRYRLSPSEHHSWSSPSLNASFDFNLDPGNYALEVEAFDGQAWHALSSPIHFKISPPWWRQWWVLTLMMVAVIVSLGIYFNNRIRKFRNEIFVKRQISDLESKALRAQMNPHFVFNSLNAIQECIVTGKIEEAYTYLSQFSRLLRLVLEHSDVANVSLHEELEVLSLFVSLEKLRFRNEMQFVLNIEEELDEEEIRIPPMLIQPHLENAIWHGLRNKEGVKILKLNIREKIPGYLEVVIEDNGIGRVKAEELRQGRLGGNKHKSKGKQLSGNRMVLLKNNYPQASIIITDLYNDEGTAAGTRVQLNIPIVEKDTQVNPIEN